MLQGYNRKLNEAKRVLEKNKKLSHALMEYNYNKDRELVLLPDRIAWRDCLSSEDMEDFQSKVGNRGVIDRKHRL